MENSLGKEAWSVQGRRQGSATVVAGRRVHTRGAPDRNGQAKNTSHVSNLYHEEREVGRSSKRTLAFRPCASAFTFAVCIPPHHRESTRSSSAKNGPWGTRQALPICVCRSGSYGFEQLMKQCNCSTRRDADDSRRAHLKSRSIELRRPASALFLGRNWIGLESGSCRLSSVAARSIRGFNGF